MCLRNHTFISEAFDKDSEKYQCKGFVYEDYKHEWINLWFEGQNLSHVISQYVCSKPYNVRKIIHLTRERLIFS